MWKKFLSLFSSNTKNQSVKKGTLRPTLYYLALETDYPMHSKDAVFRDDWGTVLYRGSKEFLEAAAMEGSAMTMTGKVLNYSSGRRGSERFKWSKTAWGDGAKCPLIPGRSVAVDKTRIPLGSILFIPALKGLQMPGGVIHDGIVYAHDVGGAIKGDRIDLFVGAGKQAMKAFYSHGIDHLKPLYYEIVGFQSSCTPVPYGPEVKQPERNDIPDPSLIVQALLNKARANVGKTEVGQNRGAWVDAINKFMGVYLGAPYCLSGIQKDAEEVEAAYKVEFGNPLTAHCKTFARKVPSSMKVPASEIRPGDWIIWGNKFNENGHAAICEDVLPGGMVKTIEYNTGPEEYINRDGGGCYRKTRKLAGYGAMELVCVVRLTNGMRSKS